MSGALITGAEKIARDVRGTPMPNDASGPTREPVHLPTTDLGNLEHLFTGAGFVQHLGERVSTALEKATGSVRGPNGGLVPSAIQHTAAAGVSVVAHDVTAGSPATTLKMALARARARAAVLLKVKNERPL